MLAACLKRHQVVKSCQPHLQIHAYIVKGPLVAICRLKWKKNTCEVALVLPTTAIKLVQIMPTVCFLTVADKLGLG